MKRLLIAALASIPLLTLGLLVVVPAFSGPPTTTLGEPSLRGAWQGQAGLIIDLNDDGSQDLVVGAPYARSGKTGRGALLVYSGSANGAFAKAPDILAGEGNLGWSLASLGDVNADGNEDFAAAAFAGSDDDVSLAGTVTVYGGSGGRPSPVSQLAGDDALDKFGYALAAGDLNGDGDNDLIVGAPFHSPSPALYQSGAVYVFFGPGYDPAGVLKIPATSANRGIGFSVASGDINADGVDDLLMQASGKVIGYYGMQGPFVPGASGPDVVFGCSDAGFGRAISVVPDANGDGFKEVAIGADQANVGGVADSGRVYLVGGGTGPRTVNVASPDPSVLARLDGEDGGRFGSAILPLADVGGEGPGLAVSAVHADGEEWLATGSVYVISVARLLAGDGLGAAWVMPGAARDMHFGAFLASDAARGLLAVGAPTQDANTGRVWLLPVPSGSQAATISGSTR